MRRAYASFDFDSNIQDTYSALTSGAAICIVPEELRLDPEAMNKYFEENQVTHAFMTTQVGRQFYSDVENHRLQYLNVGGEKLVTLDPPKNFTLVNGYGPTETTILITALKVQKAEKISLSESRLIMNCWSFQKNPFEGREYENVYKTGDIVRYRANGNIEFIGRRDSCGVWQSERQKIDIDALNKFIDERKSPYMIPAVTMQIDKIPLNQNGKVNRLVLPKPEIQRDIKTGIVAPLNVIERELKNIVAEILGTDKFDITENFNKLKLTSISAIKLATAIYKKYGIQVQVKNLI